jgi:hypothetical protein
MAPVAPDIFENFGGEDFELRVYFQGFIDEWLASEQLELHDGLAWHSGDGVSRAMVWFPVTEIAAELVERADQWRRQHRVLPRNWPAWM